jgi:DNA polymerase III subunit gamma/tau
MATIYRQYRPQTFKDLVGQNHVKITLSHEIETGKLAHAYLFCGPRGIGKTTISRVFAKALNCQNRKEGEHEPCNICDNCKEISAGKNLNIIEIDAASHTGVDNIRENIIASSRVAPSRSKYKVFIIDEVHMLSISAFNALLKILEEPPASVIFILCTTEVHKIPATIISRCQRFDLRRISVSDIVKKLQFIAAKENIKIEKDILEAIARYSEGHMRDAESLFGQIVSIGGKEITKEEADLVIPRSDLNEVIDFIACLGKKDAARAIALVNKLVDEGMDLKKFTADLIEMLRKIMLSKINLSLADKLGLELGESMELKIGEVSGDLELPDVIRYLGVFLKVKPELKESFIIQLPIEIAVAELCQPGRTDSPASGSSIPGKPSAQYSFTKKNEPAATPASQDQKPSGSTPANSTGLDREAIYAKWNEVLARVKHQNHSLSFILRVCQPKDINGNQLCLAFKYKFHKERIGEASIKSLIEKVLKDVYGQNLLIEAVIDEEMNPVQKQLEEQTDYPLPQEGDGLQETGQVNDDGGNIMDNLLKNFGGKVIS